MTFSSQTDTMAEDVFVERSSAPGIAVEVQTETPKRVSPPVFEVQTETPKREALKEETKPAEAPKEEAKPAPPGVSDGSLAKVLGGTKESEGAKPNINVELQTETSKR